MKIKKILSTLIVGVVIIGTTLIGCGTTSKTASSGTTATTEDTSESDKENSSDEIETAKVKDTNTTTSTIDAEFYSKAHDMYDRLYKCESEIRDKLTKAGGDVKYSKSDEFVEFMETKKAELEAISKEVSSLHAAKDDEQEAIFACLNSMPNKYIEQLTGIIGVVKDMQSKGKTDKQMKVDFNKTKDLKELLDKSGK